MSLDAAVLGELARTMVVGVSVAEILEQLVARMVELLPVSGAGVSIIEAGRPPLHVAASNAQAREFEGLQTRLREGPCVVAHETGRVCVASDLVTESRFPEFARQARAAGLGAVFSFPLAHAQQRLGAIDLYRTHPGELSGQVLSAASTIAGMVSAFLVNAQERSDLEGVVRRLGVARRDPLTQMANRTALSERLGLVFERWARSQSVFAVLFVDIDGFRSVNERFGYQYGDRLLTAFAQRLRSAVRPADLTARVGGDQFAVVCEDLGHADEPARIVRRVEELLRVPFSPTEQQITLTASIGVALPGPGRMNPGDLLRASDTAMQATRRPAHMPAGEEAVPSRELEAAWHERLIRGECGDEVAFTSVLSNPATGELLITQYDRHAMVVRRYEFEPTSDGVRLTVTDWDDQRLATRELTDRPDPPTSPQTLAALLESCDR